MFSRSQDGQPHAFKLARGQVWGIGRGFPGQEDIGKKVSRDHCAVGLDEEGKLLIENHQPSNRTIVRILAG